MDNTVKMPEYKLSLSAGISRVDSITTGTILFDYPTYEYFMLVLSLFVSNGFKSELINQHTFITDADLFLNFIY